MQKLLFPKVNFVSHKFPTKPKELILWATAEIITPQNDSHSPQISHKTHRANLWAWNKRSIKYAIRKFYQWKYAQNYPLITLEMKCNITQIGKCRICDVGRKYELWKYGSVIQDTRDGIRYMKHTRWEFEQQRSKWGISIKDIAHTYIFITHSEM